MAAGGCDMGVVSGSGRFGAKAISGIATGIMADDDRRSPYAAVLKYLTLPGCFLSATPLHGLNACFCALVVDKIGQTGKSLAKFDQLVRSLHFWGHSRTLVEVRTY
jgi:hypothetical protein